MSGLPSWVREPYRAHTKGLPKAVTTTWGTHPQISDPRPRDTEHLVPGSPSSSEFVGRIDELAALEQVVSAAREGSPGVVLVSGDAGIGKSTLVAEGVRRTGAALVVGRCLPGAGEVMPLAPLADLLRDVVRSNPDALSARPTLAPLREWRASGSTLDGRHAGDLFTPLLELMSDLGEDGAIVVAFEDLHWADSLTWDLFDFLAR